MAQTDLEWRVHLARQCPGKTAGLLLILAAAGALAYAVFASALPVCLLLAALISAVAEFLLPVTYRLTPAGVTRRCGLAAASLGWSDVRRCALIPDGIRLSPLPASSPREARRSITLRLPADEPRRSRVQELLRGYCPTAGREERGEIADAG